MAQRLDECPKCNSNWVIIEKIHNPDTTDMNCNATLKCEKCDHVFDDKVTSLHYKRLREKG